MNTMETRYGKADRIWVWDRGMQSAELVSWMREGGRRYVMALPKSELAAHMEALTETGGWKTVKGREVEVKYTTVNEPGSEDVLLLCRSEQRRQKEAAMHELFAGRIEKEAGGADAGTGCVKRGSSAEESFDGLGILQQRECGAEADRMRRKLRTKRGHAVYARRKEIVEPVFGQIKQGRGFRQFLLRGVDKVRSEWILICMTHNLLKLWRAVGEVPVYGII